MREWNTGHKLALIGGGAALCTDVAMNITNVLSKTGSWVDPSIPSVIVAGFVTAISAGLISQTWRERKLASCAGVTALLICAMSFSFMMSIDRVTQQHEAALRVAAEAETSRRVKASVDAVHIEEAKQAIQDENLIAIVQRECVDDVYRGDVLIKNATYDPSKDRPESWPRCASAHKRLGDLKREIAMAQAMLHATTRVEPWEVDASAKSVAYGTGLDQQMVSNYTPWLLPLVLLIGGAVLLHVGSSGRHVTFGELVKRHATEIEDRTGKRPTYKSVAKHFDISEARAKKYMA